MMVLAPIARGGKVAAVAAGVSGALVLAGLVAGVALVAALAYVAWPEEASEAAASGAPPALAYDAPAANAASQRSEELSSAREALPTAKREHDPASATEPTTARLSGIVLIDGRPPEWPIELALVTELPPSSADPNAPLWHSSPGMELAPQARSAFAFEGLPHDWKGHIAVEQFTFLDGTYAQTFDAPEEGLVLRLTARPHILGRLIDDDGRPAGNVEVAYERSIGSGIQSSSATTLNDGRFRIRIAAWAERDAQGELGKLALVANAGARGWLQHEVQFDCAVGRDLGELMLEPARERALTVRSTDGSPIPGACARIEVERPEIGCAAATDATGQGKLFLPERACAVRVSAFGFADQVVSVAPADALEFELAPLATLTLTIVAPEVDVLSLRAPRAAFAFDPTDGRDWEYQRDAGASSWNERDGGRDGRPWSYRYNLAGPNTLTLVGLVPEQPFELELFDADGRSLAVHTTRLAAGERATLTLGSASTAENR